MTLLAIEHVSKTYIRGGFFCGHETVPVLQDVSLTVEEGECVGLVGRSGSGKSTLGRIVLGLERPDAGRVLLQGRNLHNLRHGERKSVRRMVQVVFQDAAGSLNPRWTVGRSIAEPLGNFEGLRGAACTRRVHELLEQVGLSSREADKLPHALSGGQQQRVCIARALAPRPALLLLDEAVSSLDMLVQARILDLLTDLRAAHRTAYLFVSHDLRLVRRFADRAVLMDDGRLTPVDLTALSPEAGTASPALAALLAGVLPALPPQPSQPLLPSRSGARTQAH
ncbi:ABC transporter ATP-binding protein [Megalodesulfovibrio paquesii]